MMKIFKSLKNRSGMGLVEIMVTLGISSVAMVGIMATTKMMNDANRANVQNEEADNLIQTMVAILSDPNACTANFAVGAPDGPVRFNGSIITTHDIRDAGGNMVFDFNSTATYGNNKLRAVNMMFVQTAVIDAGPPVRIAGRLVVGFARQGQSSPGGFINRSIAMRASRAAAPPNTPIIDCVALGADDVLWERIGQNIVNTNAGSVGMGVPDVDAALPANSLQVAGQAYVQQTMGVGQPPAAGFSLVVSGDTNIQGNLQTSGTLTAGTLMASTMGVSGALTVGGATTLNGSLTTAGPNTLNGTTTINGPTTVNGSVTANSYCIGTNCRTTFATQNCPPGETIVSQNVDGTVVCERASSLLTSASCPANTFLSGYDTSGNPICTAMPTGSCPVGNYVDRINADGSLSCRPIPPEIAVPSCPAGTYITRISAGVPTCSTPTGTLAGQSCPAGQAMIGVNSSGNPICGTGGTGAINTSCATGETVVGFTSTGAPICQVPSGSGAGGGVDLLSMSTVSSRTTTPTHGVTKTLNLGDTPSTASAVFVNYVIGIMGGGSRADRNCRVTSTSGSYVPVYFGNDSKGDGGQKGVAGTSFVPLDPCGTLQVSCQNDGSAGYIRVMAAVGDGTAACVRVWSTQTCGYVYPIGDECMMMAACTTETAGGTCSTIGSACSLGTGQLLRCTQQ